MKILSKREQEVYKYLKNHNNLMNTSIDNLCKDLKISYATIYSLIDKLGFNGYKDLIVNIAKKKSQANNKLIDDYENIVKANFSPKMKLNVNAFVKMIKDKNVILIGKSHSNIVARKFSLDLNRLGINAYVLDNDYDQIMLAISNMSPKNVVVAITSSGKTDWIIDALKEANKKNIECITITSSPSPQLEQLNNLVIRLINGNTITSNNRVSNFIPLLIFLDMVWEKMINNM